VALTTAIIAESNTSATDAVILDAMLAEWSNGDDELGKRIAFELKMIVFFGPEQMKGHRRTNPKARSMQRSGQHYQVRKDHGTTARRKEIAAASNHRNNRTQNSAAAKRKEAKLLAFSGNPRVVTKLKRLGDLLVD